MKHTSPSNNLRTNRRLWIATAAFGLLFAMVFPAQAAPIRTLLKKLSYTPPKEQLPLLKKLRYFEPTAVEDINALFEYIDGQDKNLVSIATEIAIDSISTASNEETKTAFITGIDHNNPLIATISVKMCGQLKIKKSVDKIIELIDRYRRIKTLKRRKYDHAINVALLALGDIRDPVSIPFILSLSDQVRGFEVLALNKFGEAAVPYLIKVLKKSKDKTKLKVARRVFDSLNDPEAIPTLLREFEKKDSPLRGAVVAALLRIDTPRMLPKLVDAWIADPDFSLEQELVEHISFYKIYDRKYINFLIAILKTSKSYDSRQMTATILGGIGGREVEDALNDALCDEDQLVSMKAAYAVKKLTGSNKTAKMIIHARDCFEEMD